MENICNHAKTYLWKVCRDAQNSYQLFMCIQYSITKEAASKVSKDKTQYRIGTKKSPSKVCLLFRLIQIAIINTRFTVNTICRSLFLLDKHMRKVEYNIDSFNQYVKGQQDTLTSRGESSARLITNLFIAYNIVPDPVFKAYMTNHQDAYMDSKADYTEDKLMEITINKYKILMEAETWNAPTAQDSQIIALTAEIDALKKIDNQKSIKSCCNKTNIAWKKGPPDNKDQDQKTVGNTTYNWCIHHKYWTVHPSTDS